ncbi:Coproporphyrinogen-III oxidase, partial [Bonamia ostreae]
KKIVEIGDESLNKDDFVTKHWWFGGGCDLTPSIIYPSDCKHFHSVYKKICNKYFHRSYDLFKKKCDEYFYIPYRKEHRGVGGVFFDDLNGDREKIFSFVTEMANAFELSFIPIVSKRLNLEYSDRQKEWQEIRRGRYVEFNLLFDRGTKFGMNRENAKF